nr:hypothetical protein [Tanacetum cinerariifolium]
LSPAPPPSPIRSLGYRAAMIRLGDEAVSTSHSPPLQLPSASLMEDRPEVTLPPRKRLDIALGPRYEVGESSSAAAARQARGLRADYGFVATVDREIMRDPEREVGYGITDSWDEIVETLQRASVSTDTELGGYIREFETRVRQDTDEIYMRPEVTLPPQKRLGIALGPGYEVGESSSAAAARPAGGLRTDYGFVATMDREIMRDPEREVGYGITDSWDEIVETLQGAPVSTDTELGGYMREFETRVRRDTNEIYMRLDVEQSERQLLARLSRKAWVRSTDTSDLVHGEVMSLRTTVLGQITEIRELHAADHRRQIVISELLRADHRRST